MYVCQKCGRQSLKWLGQCPSCQEWNSFTQKAVASHSVSPRSNGTTAPAQELSQIVFEAGERFPIALPEVNRVLGGGLVPGSLILISGDPGIGKSTLLLQVAAQVAAGRGRVFYASAEETPRQIKLRAERLGTKGENIFLVGETDLEAILAQAEEVSPSMLVVDSIQTVFLPELEGAPGSVTQVRECTMRIMQWVKRSGVPAFIVGHVTKDGSIAGPRALEHIVDVVLYFEGEQFSTYRLLRCVKNRFGSTNEIGVFEMKTQGLVDVPNPSQTFLSQRHRDSIGSTVVPVLEGSRPLLVEIQALTNPAYFGPPRRTANGVDFNRLLLISAVLSKRLGLKLSNQDIMVNATGGIRVEEPAADLGIALAIASSVRDLPVDPELIALGEVGLTGELRAVTQLERRLCEAARLGFKRCIVPRVASGGIQPPKGMQVLPASTLREAVKLGLVKGEPSTSES